MNRFGSSVRALLFTGVIVASAVEVIVSAPARAYDLYMTKDGRPLRWWQRALLEYRLSTTGASDEIDSVDVLPLVEAAFDAWSAPPCARQPEVAFAGMSDVARATLPESLSAPADNVIVYVASSADWARFGNSPSWIAITKIAHDPATGEIVDADIEINDGGYRFSYDARPKQDEVDFLSTLTHEVGHFFGLDHATDATATMYANYAGLPETATDARSLAQDDIDGICHLYADVPVHQDESSEGGGCSAFGAPRGLAALLVVTLWARRRRGRARPG